MRRSWKKILFGHLGQLLVDVLDQFRFLGNFSTYPSPNPTFYPKRRKCQSRFREGVGGQFPRHLNWSDFLAGQISNVWSSLASLDLKGLRKSPCITKSTMATSKEWPWKASKTRELLVQNWQTGVHVFVHPCWVLGLIAHNLPPPRSRRGKFQFMRYLTHSPMLCWVRLKDAIGSPASVSTPHWQTTALGLNLVLTSDITLKKRIFQPFQPTPIVNFNLKMTVIPFVNIKGIHWRLVG